MRRPAIALLGLLLMATAHADPVPEAHQHDDAGAAMAAAHAGDAPVPTPLTERPLWQPVEAERVDYGVPAVQGYYAHPKGLKGAMPGVIVFHEWWGLNDNIEAMARQLAAQGYRVLAVDLYRGVRATTPEQALSLLKQALADPAANRANVEAALAFLKGHDTTRIGTLGWCFGGGQSLQAALALPEAFDATVIFYGPLETAPEKLAVLRKPVLGLFGLEDKSIPVETIRAFETALQKQGTPVDVNLYVGAGHAFANPSGRNYQPVAAEDAWLRTLDFLGRHLR